MGSFLIGVGETRILMIQSIMTLIIGLPLGFFLIPTFGIIGLIIAALIAGVPSMFWGLLWAWKHYGVKADLRSSVKIFVASAVGAIVAYAFLYYVHLAEWLLLTAGLIIFLVTYILTAPLVGAVTQSDINNLRTMLSGLGAISKILNLPLILFEKVTILYAKAKARALG